MAHNAKGFVVDHVNQEDLKLGVLLLFPLSSLYL